MHQNGQDRIGQTSRGASTGGSTPDGSPADGSPANGQRVASKAQHAHMIRLVTQSFCKELLNYGISRSEIASVAVQVLDYVVKEQAPAGNDADHGLLSLARIGDRWDAEETLSYDPVRLRPLRPDQLATVQHWLDTTDVQRSFAVLFPRSSDDLHAHFFETPDHRYFGIYYDDEFVGVIGGEGIDARFRKLEMKKFIGDLHYRGLGVGKTATFLWLYFVFEILNFNKVYIYSLDTNIRNINLNSRLGFELEGILFEDTLLESTYRDVARMSLLRSRWASIFAE